MDGDLQHELYEDNVKVLLRGKRFVRRAVEGLIATGDVTFS
jgi:hypothetical protein